jgi:hypothetical protein
MSVSLEERWTRYCMKMECKICGEPVFNHEDDAREEVRHILKHHDFGTADPPIECLRDELTWCEHQGLYCDYHTEMLDKDC